MKTLGREFAFAWIKFVVGCLLLACVTGSMAQSAPADRDAVKQLLNLIDQRLAVAPLVARAKWNSGGAIDDPVREKAILDGVTKQAVDSGLDAVFARYFFQQQFDAGKLIQRDLHRQWQEKKQEKFADAPDLARDVRPVLDKLTPQLITALVAIYPSLYNAETSQIIQAEGATIIRSDVDGTARLTAMAPLLRRNPQ